MFYSHEILTSRKYGVATVWLVATLGAKSGAKRVTRKAILEVNVGKACDTIITPEAPMALRLQSNLLYGVSRVYDQQCGYVLSDAQAAQNQIRALLKVIKSNDLNVSGAQARPEQIMLMDDPAFNPDHSLPALDFDFGNLELEPAGDSQRSTQSMLSVRERSSSMVSLRSAAGINLESSSHGGGFYNLNDPFNNTSVQKPFGGISRDFADDEPLLYDDALNFEFGEDGEMRDVDPQERGARLVDPFGSDVGASRRFRKEHEEAVAGRVIPKFNAGGDYDVMEYAADEMPMLPDDAEPFSVAGASKVGSGRPQPGRLLNEEQFSEEVTSSESAGALQKRRKPKTRKKLAADRMTELRNSDLIAWQKDYLDNMMDDKVKKFDRKALMQAKKNAVFFVIGSGINGVGAGVGCSKVPSPLEMFSGTALLAAITDIPMDLAPPRDKGKRRASAVDSHYDTEDPSTPKRSRHEEPEDEVGRGVFDDDMGMMHMNDDTSQPEMGRDAVSALLDHRSSAIFPWNVSQSLNSHARATSSVGGRLPSHRLTSASPLLGRGAPMGDLVFDIGDDNQVLYGRDDPTLNENDASAVLRLASAGPDVSESQFEIFGAAAQVDTQTAGSTQWVLKALDRESGNFFNFIQNTIAEMGVDELSDLYRDGDGDGDEGRLGGAEKFVTFGELFDPDHNSRMVAAQAFYHILTLATKGRVWVEQNVDEEHSPYGALRIGVIG